MWFLMRKAPPKRCAGSAEARDPVSAVCVAELDISYAGAGGDPAARFRVSASAYSRVSSRQPLNAQASCFALYASNGHGLPSVSRG